METKWKPAETKLHFWKRNDNGIEIYGKQEGQIPSNCGRPSFHTQEILK